MSRQHLKGYNVPVSWPVKRKESPYIAKPRPGPHAAEHSIILAMIIKEHLREAKTLREVQKILNQGKLLVNKKIVKDPKFPLGIFDIIEIPDLKQAYRVIFDEHQKFALQKIAEKDTGSIVCKVLNKRILKGKKTQLNLSGGRNIIIDKDPYSVGDSVMFDLTKKTITKHLKLEKGVMVYLLYGKHAGASGTLQAMTDYKGMRKADITIKTRDGEIQTHKDYAMVIDESSRGSK